MKDKSNKERIIDSVITLLNDGEKNITRYRIHIHSGVERSQVYSIISKEFQKIKGL